MILRLSSSAAGVLLALLQSMPATALSYSGIRNALAVHDAELNTPEGYQRAIRLEPDEATNCVLPPTEDSYFSVRRGTEPWTEVELPWTSGNDVCELHLCVRRLPSAKFPSKIGGSAWMDDVSLVGQSAENTKQ
jgi:hypothetical protein